MLKRGDLSCELTPTEADEDGGGDNGELALDEADEDGGDDDGELTLDEADEGDASQ